MQKSFWIVMPILITGTISLFVGLDTQVSANTQELAFRENIVEVQVPQIVKSVAINHDNILIICENLKVNCIRG
jgi:hypothetical protein